MPSRRLRAPLRVRNARANAARLATSALFSARAEWESGAGGLSDGSGTPYTPPTHGTAVATWGALPAAGSFIPEVRGVADMTGSGRTGTGSGLWNGTRWEPIGGTVAAGGITRHALLNFTATVTDPVITVNAAQPGVHGHTGDTDLNLLASAVLFADEEGIDVLLNGRSIKTDAVWQSPTTLQLLGRFDLIDTVEVRAP